MEIGTGFGLIGLFGRTVEQWSLAGARATMSILNITGESDNVDPLRGLILRELRDASLRRREEEEEEKKEEEQRRQEQRKERNRRWREGRSGRGRVEELDRGWSDVLEEAREGSDRRCCSLQ